MSPTTARERTQVEVEQEVDFARYAGLIASSWWLPVAGFLIGGLIGLALAKGGSEIYSARATIYLGQPTAAVGNAMIQSLSTNPSAVRQIVREDASLDLASRKSGVSVGTLRKGVSTQAVSGSLSKLGQTPLVVVSVKADAAPKKVAAATDALAQLAIDGTSAYVNAKAAILRRQAAETLREQQSIDRRLDALDEAIARGGLDTTNKLVLLTAANVAEQRRATLADQQLQSQLLLAQLREVERAHFVTHAHAVKTTARSSRNSAVVGAVLGLLLGTLAALLVPAIRRR